MKKYQLGFAFTPLLIILAALVAIGVGGYYVGKNRAITPAPQVAVSNELGGDNLADWKTYRNEELGFEMKYPSDWITSSIDAANIGSDIGVEFCPSTMGITVSGNKVQVCRYEYTSKEFTHTFAPIILAGIALNDKAAVNSGIVKPSENKTVWKDQVGGYAYALTLNDEAYKGTYQQILSTFKFTDQISDNTADWKTYQNDKYGLEIRYPQTLSITPEMPPIRISVLADQTQDNKFYVTDKTPENGYQVEVFRKQSTETLESAITKSFLNNKNLQDHCKVLIQNLGTVGSLSFFARIQPEILQTIEDYDKCPTPYSYGSKSGFLYDPNHSDKFLFFTTGEQEPPFGTANGLWWPSQSLRFYK